MLSATGFPGEVIPETFFARDVDVVARELIGVTLLVNGVGGTIVETEAYDAQDPASHSFRGPTPRNTVMFGPPGRAYVYRIYGLHWCVNFTCGDGAAVLIRAIEPKSGLDRIRSRRGGLSDRLLCAGPGRLCQALGIDGAHNGLPLDQAPFTLHAHFDQQDIAATPRIGIRVATDVHWRFCLRGSPYLSKPVVQSNRRMKALPGQSC
ncbi:MAG: DNA-3-methyladenine glycosylase [Sphingobium sp.]